MSMPYYPLQGMPVTSGLLRIGQQPPQGAPVSAPITSGGPSANPTRLPMPLPPSTVMSSPPGAQPVIGTLLPPQGYAGGIIPDWLRQLLRPRGRPGGRG